MKKLLAIILALVMVFSFCACETKEEKKEEPSKVKEENIIDDDDIEDAVRARASAICALQYGAKYTDVRCSTIDDNGDGTWNVYGYVIMTDDYGDKYKGNFDAVVHTDSKGEADCDNLYLETPVKQ